MRQKQVEASEKAREGSQGAGGATRTAIRKAPPSKVLKQAAAAAAGAAGQPPPRGTPPATSAAAAPEVRMQHTCMGSRSIRSSEKLCVCGGQEPPCMAALPVLTSALQSPRDCSITHPTNSPT